MTTFRVTLLVAATLAMTGQAQIDPCMIDPNCPFPKPCLPEDPECKHSDDEEINAVDPCDADPNCNPNDEEDTVSPCEYDSTCSNDGELSEKEVLEIVGDPCDDDKYHNPQCCCPSNDCA